jgi:hypothetical protein
MSTRGRSRKIQNNTVHDTNTASPDIGVSSPLKGAGRGARKKQFPVVAVITSEGIEGSLQPEIRRPLIAHLPIHSRDVIFHNEPMKYDPRPPSEVEPFGSFLDNPFSEQSATVGIVSESLEQVPESGSGSCSTIEVPHILPATNTNINTNTNITANTTVNTTANTTTNTTNTNTIDYYKRGELLVQFKTTDEVRKIPESSSVACFWCCHTFEGRPVVLPIHDHGDYLRVFGNFCCPECAMSYLFDMRQDTHMRWEQLALLNRVYAESVGGKIYPAPVKTVLQMFGGLYNIEEYRAMIRQNKVRVDIHIPPMVSILATMDTKPIDFYDVSLTKNVMETVKERLQKAEEVLKLRRTKPLKAWESTLDACINLRIGVASSGHAHT